MANVEEDSSGGGNQMNVEQTLRAMQQQFHRMNITFNEIRDRMDRQDDMINDVQRGRSNPRRQDGMLRQSEFGERSRLREDKHARSICHERSRLDENLGSVKMKIPLFKGKYDSNAYLRWEKKVENVFSCHDYSEKKKIRIASFSFSDHAVVWWDKLTTNMRNNGERPVATWDEMKRVMRRRFAPPQYKSHESVLEVSTHVEKVDETTNGVESQFVNDTLGVVVEEVIDPLPPKEICEEEKRESELENEKEKERNIESSLEEIEKSEKNDEKKEAEKEENKINGPIESKNQSEEVKCLDEGERSLIFTNTNNHLFSGDVSLLQENGYMFSKETFENQIDFVFGETFDSWERKELWQPKQFKEKLGYGLEHSFKWSFNSLKGESHLTPLKYLFDCSNSGIGCNGSKMSFNVDIVNACRSRVFNKFYIHDSFLFHGNRVWMLLYYMQEFVVRESLISCLMDHFCVHMLYMLSKCCYLSHMRKTNGNAYKIDLHEGYNASATFNVAYISHFDVGEDSRTNPFEERGNDTNQQADRINKLLILYKFQVDKLQGLEQRRLKKIRGRILLRSEGMMRISKLLKLCKFQVDQLQGIEQRRSRKQWLGLCKRLGRSN